ncbi:MAG: efflux RND transporter periplasmic adaptor subunit [Gammaproteobacteria bacterium]
MHRHLKSIIITGILLAIGAALGWYWSQPKPVLIKVQVVESGPVLSTVSNTRAGTVKACRRAHLSPAIGGLILKLPVNRGDQVKTNQLLLGLWNHDIAAEVKFSEEEAAATRARSIEACVVAKVARREAERLVRLRKQKLSSEEQTDRAVGEAEAREAACKAARAANRVSDARIAVTKKALERTILVAPFDGTVAEINGELGEFVTPSPPGIPTPPAIDLIDNSCLTISAPIDEVDAPKVKKGMSVNITLDAFPGERFEGQVQRIAPYVLEIEKQARTVEVEAIFTNPDDYSRLLPGYSADLEIILETRDNVLRIPTEALLASDFDGGKQHRVLVLLTDDNTLRERTIEIGLSNWKLTEVRSGLEQGDQVVVTLDRKGVEAGALVKVE